MIQQSVTSWGKAMESLLIKQDNWASVIVSYLLPPCCVCLQWSLLSGQRTMWVLMTRTFYQIVMCWWLFSLPLIVYIMNVVIFWGKRAKPRGLLMHILKPLWPRSRNTRAYQMSSMTGQFEVLINKHYIMTAYLICYTAKMLSVKCFLHFFQEHTQISSDKKKLNNSFGILFNVLKQL